MWRVLLVVGLLAGNAVAQPSETPPAAEPSPTDSQAMRDYRKCVAARADAMRDAEKLLDPDDRRNAYLEIPRCEAPRDRAGLGIRHPWELSEDEIKLLSKSEFSGGEIAGLAMLNAIVGAGIGQGFEGRWTKTGWIFFLGEGASMGLIMAGFARDLSNLGHAFDDLCFDFSLDGNGTSCPPAEPHHYKSGKSLEIAGLIGLIAFRSASIVDVVYGAHKHNERVRGIQRRAGIVPTIAPQTGGATAGVLMPF